jgi:hypothetical protein
MRTERAQHTLIYMFSFTFLSNRERGSGARAAGIERAAPFCYTHPVSSTFGEAAP